MLRVGDEGGALHPTANPQLVAGDGLVADAGEGRQGAVLVEDPFEAVIVRKLLPFPRV